MTALPVLIILLVIVGIITIAGVVIASRISVFLTAFVILGMFLVFITLLSFFEDTVREKIEKVDFIGKLRRWLVKIINFSISEKIQRIVILIMSAASATLIVRAIVIVVNAVTEYSKTESWDNMDWLIDLMGDVPVLNIAVLMKQGFETDLRADFFVIVLLLSLIVMGIAAAVVQIIMALVNKLIEGAKADSKLFRLLSNISITTLTVAGAMFVSSLISPLLNFSKPWNGFEEFFRPVFSTSVGNFLLQVLVTAVMLTLMVILCFDWVQAIVMGATGIVVLLLFQLLYTFTFGLFIHDLNNGVVWDVYWPLLCALYPIVDIIKNRFIKDNGYRIWLPAAVPLVLSIIIVLVATVIGKINPLGEFFSNPMIIISSILVFVVYMLAQSGISIIKQDRDDTGSAAAPEVGQSES